MTVMPTNELIGASLLGNEDLIATGSAFQATDPATGAALEPVYHNATAVHDTGHQMMQTGRKPTGTPPSTTAPPSSTRSPRKSKHSARY